MRSKILHSIVTLFTLLFIVNVHAIQQTPRLIPGYEKFKAQQAKAHVSSTSSFRASNKVQAIQVQLPLQSSIPKPDIETVDPLTKYPDIKLANLTQPLDHFGHSTNLTFQQRYWYSLRHYKPNSGKPTPIYVLDSGEVDGSTRLAYLDHGILDILANATNGIGVVLEHRYYGKSYPDRKAFGNGTIWGVDQLQWLTTRQALEDNAQFVQNMTFTGVQEDPSHFQAPNTPVISYGGSYPGAKSALIRLLYPDLIFGSLASSAVVAAIEQFPEYFYPIAAGAQQDCTQAIQASIGWIDKILAPEPEKGQDQPKRDPSKTKELLDLFGLTDLQDPADFANLLTIPLGSFQSLNWDPSVSSSDFVDFCTALVGEPSGPVDPAPQRRANILDPPKIVQNLANYIKTQYVQPCTSSNSTVEECFGTSDWTSYTNSTHLTDTISWTFQFCTQWGYLMTAPPYVKRSDNPYDFTPSGPKLISSLLDLNYTSQVCKKGFLPGTQFTVPDHPQTEEVNKLGNFTIDVDRLAFIDGQYDPWRPATVHSDRFAYGGSRIDTLDRPFKLIPNCWHHCDENGNKTFEPPRVRKIHSQEVQFVQHWLTQWKEKE